MTDASITEHPPLSYEDQIRHAPPDVPVIPTVPPTHVSAGVPQRPSHPEQHLPLHPEDIAIPHPGRYETSELEGPSGSRQGTIPTAGVSRIPSDALAPEAGPRAQGVPPSPALPVPAPGVPSHMADPGTHEFMAAPGVPAATAPGFPTYPPTAEPGAIPRDQPITSILALWTWHTLTQKMNAPTDSMR